MSVFIGVGCSDCNLLEKKKLYPLLSNIMLNIACSPIIYNFFFFRSPQLIIWIIIELSYNSGTVLSNFRLIACTNSNNHYFIFVNIKNIRKTVIHFSFLKLARFRVTQFIVVYYIYGCLKNFEQPFRNYFWT